MSLSTSPGPSALWKVVGVGLVGGGMGKERMIFFGGGTISRAFSSAVPPHRSLYFLDLVPVFIRC